MRGLHLLIEHVHVHETCGVLGSPCANLLDCDGNGTSNFGEGNAMSFDGF